MNALSHFIGSWKSVVTVTQANGDVISYKTSNTFSHLTGGDFVEDRAVGADEQSGHIGIWYQDADRYRSVYFIAVDIIIDENNYKWTIEHISSEGATLLRMEGLQSRV